MVKSCFLQHVRILRGRQGCPNLVCIVVSKTVFGNEISNFKTFVTTDSIGNFCETAYLHVKTCVTLKSVGKFFLKRMELGKNPTDDLCNSSKWPFWQASMKIHLILVYWDARNSLPYNHAVQRWRYFCCHNCNSRFATVRFGKCGRFELCSNECMSFLEQIFKILN